MEPIGVEEFRAAAARIGPAVVRTPLVPARGEEGLFLKPEIHQSVASFKIRGVFHAVAALAEEQRARGISTVSAGNTAQALAWTGRHFGVPARSLMPQTAPRAKIRAVESYGGTPVLVPVDEIFRFLRERAWEGEPYAFVHPWTSRELVAGHGSIGLEIVDDRCDVTSVFVPVGGGGLMAGVGGVLKALRPEVRVIAVEPEGCPALHAGLDAGRPVTVRCRTFCDGVAVPYITEEMFPLLQEVVDDCVLVSEDAVRAAVRRLAFRDKIVAEGSGALALAAALEYPRARRGAVAVAVVTGGNIDPDELVAILDGRSASRD